MKNHSLPIRRLMAALVVSAFTLLSLSAAQPAAERKTAAKKEGAKGGAAKSEAELLKEAYQTLERADHDYKGHRKAAMEQIEEAAKHLGLKLKGDGKAHEPQKLSDEQLREVRNMLEKALGHYASHANKKVPQHIEAAIKQLDTALTIK